MLSIQTMLNNLTFLINEVQHGVGVSLFTGSENTNLEHGRQVLQHVFKVLAYLDIQAQSAIWNCVCHLQVGSKLQNAIIIHLQSCRLHVLTSTHIKFSVEHCFIHIENE